MRTTVRHAQLQRWLDLFLVWAAWPRAQPRSRQNWEFRTTDVGGPSLTHGSGTETVLIEVLQARSMLKVWLECCNQSAMQHGQEMRSVRNHSLA